MNSMLFLFLAPLLLSPLPGNSFQPWHCFLAPEGEQCYRTYFECANGQQTHAAGPSSECMPYTGKAYCTKGQLPETVHKERCFFTFDSCVKRRDREQEQLCALGYLKIGFFCGDDGEFWQCHRQYDTCRLASKNDSCRLENTSYCFAYRNVSNQYAFRCYRDSNECSLAAYRISVTEKAPDGNVLTKCQKVL